MQGQLGPIRHMRRKGITLIGMPASGKSTIGKELAKSLNIPMLDVDRWMEKQEGGTPLWQVIRTKGAEYVLSLETGCIRDQDLYGKIISTPGSIIYNDVLKPLQEQTYIVYLSVSLAEIERRLSIDTERQGEIIGIKEKGLDGLFAERTPLYEEWAQYVIDCDGKSQADITAEVIALTRH